jgi:hypothetical protein
VNVFRVLETLCHCAGTLLNIESRTSSAQPYVFDSGVEAQVNVRRCSLNGLGREIAGNSPACAKSSELIRRNLRAGEYNVLC